MKQFNLKEALAGKPVVTRDGRKVTKISKIDVNHTNPYSVYALVDEKIESWTESGKSEANIEGENPLDLFMDTQVLCMWANVYKVKTRLILSIYDSEDKAIEHARNENEFTYIKTIAITDENETI
jgi:sporulation protein YlmC with PRC-barrel domain